MRIRLFVLTSGLAIASLLAQPSLAQPPARSPGGCIREVANAPTDPFSLGPLTLGMSEDDVEKAIGEPKTRYDTKVDDLSGQQTHATAYSNGVSLTYSDDPEIAGPGKLIAIIVDESADWQGVGGLRLGMASADARALVKALVGGNVQPFPMDSKEDVAVIFGETYTMLQVRCYEGKVSYIYLGPAPE